MVFRWKTTDISTEFGNVFGKEDAETGFPDGIIAF